MTLGSMDSSKDEQRRTSEKLDVCSFITIFGISAAIITLQIALMRSFSALRYHHFSYFVISTALLGFGFSGTFLHFTFRYFRKRYYQWSFVLVVLFTLSIPLTYNLTLEIPLDIQYIFYDRKQTIFLLAYTLLLFIPFFLGASNIGFALQYFKESTPLVYALNLLGSATGGVLAIVLMYWMPATVMPQFVSIIGVLTVLSFLLSGSDDLHRKDRFVVLLVVGIVTMLVFGFLYYRPKYNVDPYKAISHIQRLEKQSDAMLLTSKFSPHGQIDIFDSNKIHYTLFTGLTTQSAPPEQLTLLIDGHHAGAIFKIRSKEEASILDDTPQSLVYRLLNSPKVLLLGERTGVNVWLALRFGATDITIVQSNPQLIDIMKFDLSDKNGDIYNRPEVKVICQDPRLFIQTTREKFDVIHVVVGEGVSAGTSGLLSLHEDYLLTKEGIAACYRNLTSQGMITLTRGIQYPPRDNIKIFSLFAAALEQVGPPDVSSNLLQVRNYMAVNTIISKTPLTQVTITKCKEICEQLLLDIEYHRFISSDNTNQFNMLQGPPNVTYSYLHHAILNILSDKRNLFYDEWIYDVRPSYDNSPYFYNFFKWRSLKRFLEVYGKQIFQKLELGYLVLVFSFLASTAFAFLVILLPLFFLKLNGLSRYVKIANVIYFLSLGFAFMFLEMVFIQKFIKFLGDPIFAVSIIIVSLLLFAGIGSISQNYVPISSRKRVVLAVCGILLFAILAIAAIEPITNRFGHHDLIIRLFITVLLVLPVSFLMGWMFPLGISLLQIHENRLIPWAWGLNGFGSVSAAPLAVMLSMQIGFNGVIAIALGLYVMAGIAYFGLTSHT